MSQLHSAVSDVAANEDDTLAAIVHLLRSGQVRLSAPAMMALRELLGTMTAAASAVRTWCRSTGPRGSASLGRAPPDEGPAPGHLLPS
jgi:hypothetical protein